MPETWSAEKDQKLLLYAVELGMIKVPELADLWVKKEGTEVSTSAVRQHLNKLRTKTGLSKAKGKGGTPSKSTTTTPRKSASPKTPKSSGKRKKSTMSDEDDSKDKRLMNHDSQNSSKQQKAERGSNTPKTYREPDTDDDADDEAGAGQGFKQENGGDDFGNAFGNGDANDADSHAYLDAMSEVSDFAPGLQLN